MSKNKQFPGEKKNIRDPKKEKENILVLFGSLPSKEIENMEWKQIRKEARDELINKKHT